MSSSAASPPPVILTIAGSDSSAGAGLQADLKAIAAHRGYGLSAVTCVVSEIPGEVSQVLAVDPGLLADQLRLLSKNYPIAAIKTGMLANTPLCEVVAEFLENTSSTVPVVVDPVMVATSGDRLLDTDAVEIYRQQILPRADLATPNLDEARALLDREIPDLDAVDTAAHEFHRRLSCPVIIKGGHLAPDEPAVDVFFDGRELHRHSAPRIEAVPTHGTGCTLSATLAALLGHGKTPAEACVLAKTYITAAIAQSHHWPQPSDIHALNHQPDGVDFSSIQEVATDSDSSR